MLSINTNLSSLIAQNSLKNSTDILNTAVERMTTGYKINHSKDNAAGYSISTNMQTMISSYDVAADNVAMGMDLVTTAMEIVSNMQNKANRLQALCTQARNGTYGAQSMEAIISEADAIMAEINRISSTAEYNGIKLFEGGTEGNGFISNPVSYTESQVAAMTTMTELVNGTTSADNKYSISSVKELEALAEYINDQSDGSGMTFVLGTNIDLSSVANWTPIGSNNYFYGTFDGNGHIIKNLKIDSTENYQGLFGFSYGEIKNIGLENCDVKGGSSVGGLVGGSSGSITNCYTIGTVSGNDSVGGLVGDAYDEISNSYAIVDVSGNDSVGGFVGYAGYEIKNCYATGNVKGNTYVGGLVGETDDFIYDSYATGNVSGNDSVGGLAGYLGCVAYDSYATGNVSGNNRVGGLIGYAYATVINSYATGSVTGPAGANSVNNSADWTGTKFTYNYESAGYSINLDGSNTGAFTLQVGINGDSSCQISFDTNFFYMLGAVKSDITSDRALDAIMKFTAQLSEKSTQLGAAENRLQSSLESIEVNIENLTSSLSTIRDADIAEVSSQYIQQQILQQASATLMATANQNPAIALQLI